MLVRGSLAVSVYISQLKRGKRSVLSRKTDISHFAFRSPSLNPNMSQINVLKNDLSSFAIRSVYKQVHSEYKTLYAMDCYTNEIKWLRKLQSTGIVPRLLITNDERQAFVTEYVGEPVCAATLPHDWKAQRDHILSILKQYNCRHNDIKPSEILVQNGRLRVVDFGWASFANQPNPANYPACLGSLWKCPSGHNDRYSFDESIKYVKSIQQHT